MNIMFFLTHKSEVTYLYEDMELRKAWTSCRRVVIMRFR